MDDWYDAQRDAAEQAHRANETAIDNYHLQNRLDALKKSLAHVLSYIKRNWHVRDIYHLPEPSLPMLYYVENEGHVFASEGGEWYDLGEFDA